MQKLQRKIYVPKEQELAGVDSEQKITKIVIGEKKKVFKLKNVMPSGIFSFRDDQKEYVAIDGGREFEVTDSELESFIDSDGFKDGLVIFAQRYPEYDEFNNSMSDEKVAEMCDLKIKDFEKELAKIDGVHTFIRIKDIISKNNRPTSYYQLVQLREAKLAEDFRKANEYVTDEERNRQRFAPNF